jgi:cytoplasmic tRNA 2-thiolation protein 1
VLLNLVRGDAPRLARTASPITGEGGPLPRVKPLARTYEKEIVLYAHFKALDYFSTECVYSPFAARGATRDAVKSFEAVRPSAIAGLVRAAQTLVPRSSGGDEGGRREGGRRAAPAGLEATAPRACTRCGYMTSQPVCKACELLAELNERKARRGGPRVAIAYEE